MTPPRGKQGARQNATARPRLVSVPSVLAPARKLIEASAFAAYNEQGSIAQILSGAVELAKSRGFLFLTHREIGARLHVEGGSATFAYSLALAIAVAAGPARAQSICATVIQTTGARIVVDQSSDFSPAMVGDARAVIKTMMEL